MMKLFISLTWINLSLRYFIQTEIQIFFIEYIDFALQFKYINGVGVYPFYLKQTSFFLTSQFYLTKYVNHSTSELIQLIPSLLNICIRNLSHLYLETYRPNYYLFYNTYIPILSCLLNAPFEIIHLYYFHPTNSLKKTRTCTYFHHPHKEQQLSYICLSKIKLF